ncbi:MAG TPA: PAS domain-containing protein, partial [Rhizobacter sp.]|nr:PAS domain-containing protein [Rhizobacter sp.]
VWDLDVRSQKVHYSPQWKAMLGYEDTDVADSTDTWRSRVHPDDLQPMLAALTQHLDGRDLAYEMEFRLRAADGTYRWVLSRGRVVERADDGRALRAVGTLTDLTHRHHAECQRVEQDAAAAGHRAQKEFLARMSHELRTPLNAVLGFAQLLSHQIGSPAVNEQREYIAHIEEAGWHLLHMIDDATTQWRIEHAALETPSGPDPLDVARHTDSPAGDEP